MKYQLATLGWYNFESLCQTILKSIIGPGVSSFGGSVDGGRDATFSGVANFPSTADRWRGRWTFQAKHIDTDRTSVKRARESLVTLIANELKTLLLKHPVSSPDNYILLTNVPLTAMNRDKLDAAIKRVAGYEGNFRVLDGDEICQWLDTYPHIRRAFPQLLALADLETIINKDVYSRSEAYLRAWQPRLAAFVRTSVYDRAFDLLGKHHYILLDGPPEAGRARLLRLWRSGTRRSSTR